MGHRNIRRYRESKIEMYYGGERRAGAIQCGRRTDEAPRFTASSGGGGRGDVIKERGATFILSIFGTGDRRVASWGLFLASPPQNKIL